MQTKRNINIGTHCTWHFGGVNIKFSQVSTSTVDIFVRSVTVHCRVKRSIAQRALETSPVISLMGKIFIGNTNQKTPVSKTTTKTGMSNTYSSTGQHLFGSINVATASRTTLSFRGLCNGARFQFCTISHFTAHNMD